MTISIYAIMFIPLLLELLVLIQLERYIKFLNIHLTDLVFYYRDSHYDKKSINYIPSKLDDIQYELHQLYKSISEGSLDVNVFKDD